MLFDKTGTLTSGNADVAALATEPATDVRLILGRATQLASASNHSLASSICRYASGLAIANAVDGFRTATLDELRTIPGKGLQAQFVLGSEGNVGRELVWLGSLPWLREEGLAVSDPLWNAVETAGGREAPLSGVAWGGRVHGIFVFHEQVRPETVQALNQCRALGIHVAVVTGDRRPRAERLAASLGVPVLAEQLPEHKVAAIEESRRKYGSVAMVGDGINDAPALGASDVGIAMGCGADLSREAAAVCLLSDDLTRLPWSVALARQTVRIIRQNLFWAFSYNIVGIGLAACGRLSPVFAALAMVASSAFVISNSLRLGRFPDTAHESIAADQQGHGGAMADGNMPAGSPGYAAEHDVSLSQKPSPDVELQTTTI
jgi:cation transport ATPase